MSDELDLVPLVPPPTKARELGFSDDIFDMLAEKKSIDDLGEYIDDMKVLGYKDKEGRRMFEFLWKEIIGPRLSKAPAQDQPKNVTPEAAVAMLEQVMANRRRIKKEVDVTVEIEGIVHEKARVVRDGKVSSES